MPKTLNELPTQVIIPAEQYRRGIHVPVDEIAERAESVRLGRMITTALLFIPYFICFVLARIVTRFIAACQEGWESGKRPTHREG